MPMNGKAGEGNEATRPANGRPEPPGPPSRTEPRNPDGRLRLKVTTYDGTEVKTYPPKTRAEVQRDFNLKAYDSCFAECLAVCGFRNPRSGQWEAYGQGNRKIAGVTKKILKYLQLHAGVYFEKGTLYVELGIAALSSGPYTNVQVYRMRLSHRETKTTEHYILTEDDRVAWRPSATWTHVELTTVAAGQENGRDDCTQE